MPWESEPLPPVTPPTTDLILLKAIAQQFGQNRSLSASTVVILRKPDLNDRNLEQRRHHIPTWKKWAASPGNSARVVSRHRATLSSPVATHLVCSVYSFVTPLTRRHLILVKLARTASLRLEATQLWMPNFHKRLRYSTLRELQNITFFFSEHCRFTCFLMQF